MSSNLLIPESKLLALGTTIFTQMSALAQQYQTINLPQGFPDFDGPRYLQERLAYHVAQGVNQYAPVTGVLALREAIVGKTAELYDYLPDVNSDTTVTAGATEALYAAITALMRRGDEVTCFDPSYDNYAPAVALAGDELRRITLQPPHFRVDWRQFATALNDKTHLAILNTSHNPSATVWQREDFAALWQAIAECEIYVLSDEVYEHTCFAEDGHANVLAHPQLRERAVAVSSFGKTSRMTGWKVGYCVVPAAISAKLRKVHQYLTFLVNTPAQLAIADMLREAPEYYCELLAFYRKRRDLFIEVLRPSRLELLPCEGTYFLLASYSAISDLDDVSFCRWLTTEVGVATIPLSVFCVDPFPHKLIRLCFVKQPAILLVAVTRLCQLQSLNRSRLGRLAASEHLCEAANLLQAQYLIGIHPQLFVDFLWRPAKLGRFVDSL